MAALQLLPALELAFEDGIKTASPFFRQKRPSARTVVTGLQVAWLALLRMALILACMVAAAKHLPTLFLAPGLFLRTHNLPSISIITVWSSNSSMQYHSYVRIPHTALNDNNPSNNAPRSQVSFHRFAYTRISA